MFIADRENFLSSLFIGRCFPRNPISMSGQELSGDISSYTVQPLINSGHTCLVVHYTRSVVIGIG